MLLPSRMRFWRHLSLLGLGLYLLCAGCCTDPATGHWYFCLSEPTERQEVELGSRYARDFTAQLGGPYPDPELQAFLEEIVVGRLAKESARPGLPWKFTVVNTSQVNAFALPGGQVFITRGLLALLDSEAQFAHAMAHELGHVCHKHFMRGQGRQVLLNPVVWVVASTEGTVGSWLGRPDDPLYITGAVGTVAQAPFLQFNREQEIESDRRGVDYALAAGYDPREGEKTFETFQKLKKKAGHRFSLMRVLLSTHPLDWRRIRALHSYISSKYPEVESRNDLVVKSKAWDDHMMKLRSEHMSYERLDRARQLVDKGHAENDPTLFDQADTLADTAARALPGHAAPQVTQALIDLGRKRSDDAVAHLDRAIEFDSKNYEAQILRGLVLRQRGDVKRAEKDLIKANELFPGSPIPCYQLGQVTEQQGFPEAATKWYLKALERAPRGSPVRKLARQRLDALK